LSNLDFSVEAEPIERAMSKSGKVVEVRLVRNPVGKSKGFAFVEFATEREAR
jgi:RNA recognition motif-containing protein